jgi:hypothetical protein
MRIFATSTRSVLLGLALTSALGVWAAGELKPVPRTYVKAPPAPAQQTVTARCT